MIITTYENVPLDPQYQNSLHSDNHIQFEYWLTPFKATIQPQFNENYNINYNNQENISLILVYENEDAYNFKSNYIKVSGKSWQSFIDIYQEKYYFIIETKILASNKIQVLCMCDVLNTYCDYLSLIEQESLDFKTFFKRCMRDRYKLSNNKYLLGNEETNNYVEDLGVEPTIYDEPIPVKNVGTFDYSNLRTLCIVIAQTDVPSVSTENGGIRSGVEVWYFPISREGYKKSIRATLRDGIYYNVNGNAAYERLLTRSGILNCFLLPYCIFNIDEYQETEEQITMKISDFNFQVVTVDQKEPSIYALVPDKEYFIRKYYFDIQKYKDFIPFSDYNQPKYLYNEPLLISPKNLNVNIFNGQFTGRNISLPDIDEYIVNLGLYTSALSGYTKILISIENDNSIYNNSFASKSMDIDASSYVMTLIKDYYNEFIAHNKNYFMQSVAVPFLNDLGNSGRNLIKMGNDGGGLLSTFMNVGTNIYKTNLHIDNLKNTPDAIKQQGNDIYTYGEIYPNYQVMVKKLKDIDAQLVFEKAYRYGYLTENFFSFFEECTNRINFNFIQVQEDNFLNEIMNLCSINGCEMSPSLQQSFTNAFLRGTRLWHNSSINREKKTILNFEYENYERSLINV